MKKGLAAIWVIIITVLIMAGLGAGGYCYLNSKYSKDKNNLKTQISDLQKKLDDSTDTSSTSTSSTSIVSSSSSSTSNNLTTYTNKTYGYSFQYPSAYQLIDYLYDTQTKAQVKKGVYAIVNKTAVPANTYVNNADMPQPYFMVSVEDSEFGLSSITSGSRDTETVTDITMAGATGWKVIENAPSDLDGSYSTSIYLNQGGKGYRMSWKNDNAQGVHDVAIDNMAGSFQFTS
jgi:hypothetical protein